MLIAGADLLPLSVAREGKRDPKALMSKGLGSGWSAQQVKHVIWKRASVANSVQFP